MLVTSTFSLKPGDKAPDFSLPDAEGRVFSLDEVRGIKGTLVVFLCNHCPYVIHLASQLGSFTTSAAARDVNTVAINANDLAAYPQDGPGPMKAFAAANGWTFPYLIDESQQVAKNYGAACTPDFFLFDAQLRLYYAGQFDDSRPNKGVATGAGLQGAVDALLAGEPPPVDVFPASGCNIKWKPGQEPAYFGG